MIARNVSPWRSSGLVHAILLLACTKPNPAFDPDASASASASASESESVGPTSAASTTPSSTVANPSTSTVTGGSISATDSDSITTDDPTSPITSTTDGATTDPGCGGIGEPCGASNCCKGCGLCMAGICMPDDGACGPCGTCGANSECTPQPSMTPCKLADDPCVDKLWGLENGSCFAYAPAEGLCDGGDQCQPRPCEQGEKLIGCDLACLLDSGNCQADMPVAQVDANILCVQDGVTPLCKTECITGDRDDKVFQNSCQAGVCTILASTSCGKYTCLDEQSCDTNCMSEDDCKEPHQCDMNQCK